MSTASELAQLTLTEAAARAADGSVSPVDLVEACLSAIEASGDGLHAFISVQRQAALAAARAAATMLARGDRPGPLHGVPLVVKDNIAVARVPCTAGSRILATWVPEDDATVVARLKGAGAIILGKANLHEFAYGGSSANPHFGTVENPWRPGYSAGGSSSGSAAAVAARFSFGSLGTDTGGSVRLPAAMTGIVGLRPTQGRVSNHGTVPLAPSMDTVGPMTRTVEDNALLLSVIAGHDPLDQDSASTPVDDYLADLAQGVRGLRIGVVGGYRHEKIQPAVRNAFEQALATLGQLGASVAEASIPGLELAPAAKQLIQATEPAAFHRRWLRERPGDYSADVRTRLQAGQLILATHYVQAQRYRARLRRHCDDALRTYDVLVSPTIGFAALTHDVHHVVVDGEALDAVATLGLYTALASLTGFPALSVPCGFDEAGLPIGLQIIGPPFAERLLYRVAAAYQNATDFHRRAPQLHRATA